MRDTIADAEELIAYLAERDRQRLPYEQGMLEWVRPVLIALLAKTKAEA